MGWLFQNLKSPQELEEEDRQAKSAVSSALGYKYRHRWPLMRYPSLTLFQKLQELIRRGTPKDLLAAQELMKDLSGAVRPSSADHVPPYTV